MAEETPAGAATPDAPAPADHAAIAFDRAADRAGLPEPDGSADRPTAGVLTGEEPPPKRSRPAAPEPAAPDPRQATDEYVRRRQEKLASRERVRQDRILEVLAREADRLATRTPDDGAPAPAIGDEQNPYDMDTQYFEWQAWREEARDKKLLAAWQAQLDLRLGPVQQFFETQAQQQERLRAEAQQRAQQEGWRAQMREVAGDAHDAYAATAEGQGYLERVAWAIGDPGDPGDPARGIPPRPARDGSLKIAWLAAFPDMPEELADDLTHRHLNGIIQLAERWNQENPHRPVNPARALDMFSRGLIASAAPFYAQGNGNGHRAAPAAQPAGPSPAQARVRELKQGADSAVAGGATDGGARAGGDLDADVRLALSKGRLDPPALRAICLRYVGKPTAANLKELAKRASKIRYEMGLP